MRNKQAKCPRIRVAGMIVKGNSVLLVKHQRADREYYLLPGGGLEWGETLPIALQREFEEELSLQITVGPLLFINESIEPSGKRHIVNFTFLARIKSGTLRLHPDARLRDVCWVDRKKLMQLDFYPEIRKDMLRAWQQRFKGKIKMIPTPWNE